MILNHRGEEVKKDDRHRFGHFVIPEDARLNMGDSGASSGYVHVPSQGWTDRDYVSTRCEKEKK